jgi:NADH:ubiquinone oxidoreductase subunit H
MGNIKAYELVIVLMVAIAVIVAYTLAIRKIINSKITPNQKIAWIFVIIFFNFVGLVVFLVYHDIYLSPPFRGNL